MPSTPLFTYFFGIDSTMAALGSIALSVGLLILLIAAGKIPPLIGFAISSVVAALLLGMPLGTVLKSIEKGMGDLIGSLLLIICLGAMYRSHSHPGSGRTAICAVSHKNREPEHTVV